MVIQHRQSHDRRRNTCGGTRGNCTVLSFAWWYLTYALMQCKTVDESARKVYILKICMFFDSVWTIGFESYAEKAWYEEAASPFSRFKEQLVIFRHIHLTVLLYSYCHICLINITQQSCRCLSLAKKTNCKWTAFISRFSSGSLVDGGRPLSLPSHSCPLPI